MLRLPSIGFPAGKQITELCLWISVRRAGRLKEGRERGNPHCPTTAGGTPTASRLGVGSFLPSPTHPPLPEGGFALTQSPDCPAVPSQCCPKTPQSLMFGNSSWDFSRQSHLSSASSVSRLPLQQLLSELVFPPLLFRAREAPRLPVFAPPEWYAHISFSLYNVCPARFCFRDIGICLIVHRSREGRGRIVSRQW